MWAVEWLEKGEILGTFPGANALEAARAIKGRPGVPSDLRVYTLERFVEERPTSGLLVIPAESS